MKDFEKQLVSILQDNESGSVGILDKIVDLIDKVAKSDPDNAPLKNFIYSTKENITRTFPFFKASDHYLTHLVAMMNIEDQNIPLASSILNFNNDYKKEWSNVNQRIAKQLLTIIDKAGKTILVHSNSSTLVAVFSEVAALNYQISIIQTESRPAFEGRVQAAKLSQLGYKVTLIVDAAVSKIVNQIDLAVMGCDSLYADAFINKIGTETICRQCVQGKKPVYLLADSRKISASNAPDPLPEIEKPPALIWDKAPENVKPLNFYFESIPLSLVTVLVSENKVTRY